MDKTKLAKYATAAAMMTGMAVTLPTLAPFVAPFITPLMTGILSEETTRELGKKGVEAAFGIFGNLAASAIWESPDAFAKSPENQDLLRLLANAYLKTVKEIEIPEDAREQAGRILPLLQKRIERGVAAKKADDLLMLFPHDANSRAGDLKYSFANRLVSEDVILKMVDESFSETDLFADEIEIALRRWYNEQKNAESQKETRLTTIGLSSVEQIPEPLRTNLREQLSKSIPKKIGELVKTEEFNRSWIAFQRLHLQALLKEINNRQSGLSDEDRELLKPLAERLDELSNLSGLPERLAAGSSEILERSDKSKDEIKDFIQTHSVHLHKHLSGMEKRLSGQLSGAEERLSSRLGEVLNAVNSQQTARGLPSNIPKPQDFVGRAEYLKTLRERYTDGKRCFVLYGLPGAGKTEIAKQFAYENIDEYDAHISINLRGASANPMTAADAMWEVITLFNPEQRRPEIPLDLNEAEQIEFELRALEPQYTQLFNKHKILLILDNAKDAAQTAPLNNLNGDCLIVTARHRIMLGGCEALNVEEMSETDAIELLERKLRKARFDGQTENIAALCGRLPLALRAAEGVLFNQPSLRAARYAERLKESKNRLELHNPERNISVEAAFALSYDYLTAEQQFDLRRLSVFPVSFDTAAAAAVWQIEPDAAGDTLAELESYALIKWNKAADRFILHDLMRVFAAKKLSDDERFQTQYLFAAHYASILTRAQVMQENQEEDYFTKALKLLDAEWDNITAGQKWSAEFIEQHDLIAELCTNYSGHARDFIILRLHSRTDIEWLESGLKATRKLKNRRFEGNGLGNLGLAYDSLGEYRKAIEHHEQHLAISREIGDRLGEGNSLGNLGNAYYRLGNYRKAIEYHEQNLAISREIGSRLGEGNSLGNLGSDYFSLGNYQKAIEYYDQHLAISREIGDRLGEGNSLSGLGIAYDSLGEYRKAIEYHEQHLAISREIGDRLGEGNSLGNLGNAYYSLGDYRKAIEYHKQALKISRETATRLGEGQDLSNLGLAYHSLGENEKACILWKEALEIFEAIESPTAKNVRRWIEKYCD